MWTRRGSLGATLPKYSEVLSEEGKTEIMLGNAAIARGLLEGGLQFASAYPGTPSTEITEALSYFASKKGVPYVEWSTNEKVALEAALGAAISGLKAFTGMKHVGLNVAADPFFSSAYLGVDGALVVVSADDPWMWSSQNEQDNRIYGLHAFVPVIEPRGVQEAKEAARLALEWSYALKRPFLFRITTRIAHSRAPITLGKINLEELKAEPRFRRDPSKWTLIPEFARRHRVELLRFWEEVKGELSDFPLNSVEGSGEIAVLASGIGYVYAKEAVKDLEIPVTLIGISTPVPLPDRVIEKALEHDKVIVIEEGEPVVEAQLREEAQKRGSKTEIFGKMDGTLRRYGELDLAEVREAIGRTYGMEVERPKVREVPKLPPRPPVLCPGCPYRSYFYALKRAVNKARVEPIYSGDIGCYSLGITPPFEVQDIIIDMGASIGAGGGMAQAFREDPKRLIIAIIGDSTFYHSGVTSLINVVYNQAPLLTIILDNYTTAMTGHQPHPGVGIGAGGRPAKEIDMESVVKGIGVEKVLVADAFSIKDSEEKTLEAIKYVIEQRKPAVVIAKGACSLVALAHARRKGIKVPQYYVEESKCTACGICYKAFNCPAIIKKEDGKAWIDPSLCVGCGQCEQICPFGAFVIKERVPEWDQLLRTAKPRW
ncbi:indolepyruvate ferredoxin oxidoreductase [Ignicoccus pacificus DSM 13166]|uniref:Indolepyruvate ferredoxin oxidoreductase subunit alpha n=1 Tax=Ignicoccus pacificus DSM 13166 TaxID=940294 RepID=A0A977K931_9CREN|nr:indolepyruvate ferredoxin oxidoreductase [Ignicoccus pacificus DSM 13166]